MTDKARRYRDKYNLLLDEKVGIEIEIEKHERRIARNDLDVYSVKMLAQLEERKRKVTAMMVTLDSYINEILGVFKNEST